MLRLKDKIEASVTYADRAETATTADSAKVANKIGSSGVGNAANFIYLNAGIPTASTSTIGGSSNPIYMKSGVMTPCGYTLRDACAKSVRSKSSVGDSGWKDNATDDGYVPTMSFIAYWNGAYSESASNLAYCKHGAFGTIVTKNAGDYAPGSHTHSSISMNALGASIISDGDNDASNGVGGAINNIKISSWNGVSFTTSCAGQAYTNKTAVGINCRTGAISANSVTANAVYNAVYNDYAEFFPRGEATEPGDIVALDLSSDHESYIKATATSKIVAGVHSDEYAMLIGGDKVDDGNYVEKNLERYIPVSLAGRVMCKVTGPVHRGDTIIVSDIPGVGIATDDENIPHKRVVGYVVEDDDRTDIRRVKIRVKG
jgi:hypothetical protein